MKNIIFRTMFFALMLAFCNDVKAQEVAGYDSVMTVAVDQYKNATPQSITREVHYNMFSKIARWIQRVAISKISKTEKGSTNGVAPLDATGKVPAVHIPVHGHAASQVTGLSAVATTGNYNDLSVKPNIPAAQVQTDWNATSGMGRILNQPNLADSMQKIEYNINYG